MVARARSGMMAAMRIAMVLLCPLVGLATLLTSCGRPADHAASVRTSGPQTSASVQRLSQPEPGQVAGPVDPDPRVGAIFFDSGTLHSCTGSVVHSTGGDLVLTAAHCLSGRSQATFVPGFAGDDAPTDLWTVHEIYFDPRWLATKDPHADYAIARVSGDRAGMDRWSHTSAPRCRWARHRPRAVASA